MPFVSFAGLSTQLAFQSSFRRASARATYIRHGHIKE